MSKKYLLNCTADLQQENTHRIYTNKNMAYNHFKKEVEKAKSQGDICEIYTEDEAELYYETKNGTYRIYIEELYEEEYTRTTLGHLTLRVEVLKERMLGGEVSKHQLTTEAMLACCLEELESVFYYKPEYSKQDEEVFQTLDMKKIILHLADVVIPRLVNEYKEEDGK